MKVVYIAGAFRAPTHYQIHQNVLRAERAALKLWKQGYAVICPHKNTEFYQDECTDDVWLSGCLEILKRCDIIYMLRHWENSKGACEEHELAINLGIEVRYE